MKNNELKIILELIFEQAYQLGINDGLEGVHICPKEQFREISEKNGYSLISKSNNEQEII